MAFRFAPRSFSSGKPSPSSSPRPIKSPKHIHALSYCPDQQFSVPGGPNWVYASGGSRTVRFDFNKALDEQIASEDETCGSSQEYYARKLASSSLKGDNRSFSPPVSSAFKPNPQSMYPSQVPNYTFNFDHATPVDVENMNAALPFGPLPGPERKQKIRKDIEKCIVARPPLTKQSPFEFGSKSTIFSTPTLFSATQTGTKHIQIGFTTSTARSQNHDERSRRVSSKSRKTMMRKKL